MRVRGKDKVIALFEFCLGASSAILACRYGLGTFALPGPGFLPFLAGLTMTVISIIIFHQTLKPSLEDKRKFLGIGNRRILIFLICLILYSLSITKLGFLIGNFFLLSIIFQLVERKSWFVSILISATIVFILYLIFIVWLKVQFPKGLINF